MKTENLQENQCLTARQSTKSELEDEGEIKFFELLKYSTKKEKLLMIIGSIAAICNGVTAPIFYVIFGRMTNSFFQTSDELVFKAGTNAIYFILAAAASMIFSFIMFATWMITGENQGIEYRKKYFASLLKQDIGWFDTINPNELNTKVANETFSIQGAIGEKVPTFIMTISHTFFGFLFAFLYGWQLSLVITTVLPVISISLAIFATTYQASEEVTHKAYLEASSLAEQALYSIKTVKMLDGEEFEVERYKKSLWQARTTAIRYQFFLGLTFGIFWAAIIWAYALGFWYGAKLIADQTLNHNFNTVYTAEDVIVIFYEIINGGFALGQAVPCLQNFAKGKQAAKKVFKILNRIPKIQHPQNGQKIEQFKGIQMKNIKFSYPNRPDQLILNGLNLYIPAGKKIALVGESGCGKSTIIQLIERFYDCDEGSIIFDGTQNVNIKDLDLNDLRSNIGLVGQEPVLFATSIKENLLYGKEDATDNEIIEALKQAHAWEFVSKLDKGIETQVGIGGGLLSGGQKQRIAIARAILKKPKILLLDEATSALDSVNERLVQGTLDDAFKNITIIMIAHRLTTIQNADLIYVIEKGEVIEKGTHMELINLGGKYMNLAQTQIQEQHQENLQEKHSDSPSIQILINKKIDQGLGSQKSIRLQTNNCEVQNIVSASKKETNAIKETQQTDFIIKGSEQLLKQPDQEKNEENTSVFGLLHFNTQQGNIFLMIGIVIAIGNGCVVPIFSQYLSSIITVLVESNPMYADQKCFNTFKNPNEQLCQLVKEDLKSEVQTKANSLSVDFLMIGFAALILWTLQQYILSYVGQTLTFKLNLDTYRKLLRMPVSYFDNSKNKPGIITSRLLADCKSINTIFAFIIGLNLSNISALFSGLIISFIASWQITLILLGLTPLSYLGRVLQARFLQGFSDSTDQAYQESGNLIMETLTNIRTVASLGNDEFIHKLYASQVQIALLKAQKKGIYAGLALGFSKMQIFIINAVVFYVGALLCRDQYIQFEDMLKSIQAIDYATWSAGNNAAFTGDISEAKKSSNNIQKILKAEDEYQKQDRLKKQKLTTSVLGDIIFKNLTFKYQGRDRNVFDNLCLTIKQGQKVALVGESGCGKSTIIQMLMRFYEPDQGQIMINGVDITEYDIKHLRRQFAIVSQEPTLFNGTISENIQYNQSNAVFEDIVQAAKLANAYDFITQNQFEEVEVQGQSDEQQSKGHGFDRQVGPKGTQISGGQKQRIAIARAILRNSSILMLDEATSALDTTSEQIVKESLSNLMQSKTSIVIAHRISTIKDSDKIYVLNEGQIVEEGDYESLLQQKGFFKAQNNDLN